MSFDGWGWLFYGLVFLDLLGCWVGWCCLLQLLVVWVLVLAEELVLFS